MQRDAMQRKILHKGNFAATPQMRREQRRRALRLHRTNQPTFKEYSMPYNRPRSSTKFARTIFVDQLREEVENLTPDMIRYENLAEKLDHCRCMEFTGKRCQVRELCPNCNYHYQVQRWRTAGFNKTRGLISAGAIPLWMRGSVLGQEDVALGIANLLQAIQAFKAPFLASFTTKATDLRSRSVISGIVGIHVSRGHLGWHPHAHMLIWLKPGPAALIQLIKKILKKHWILSADCDDNGVRIYDTYENRSMYRNVSRIHQYIAKPYLESVKDLQPDEYFKIKRAMNKTFHVQEFGLRTDSLFKNDHLEPLDVTRQEIVAWLNDGVLPRRKPNLVVQTPSRLPSVPTTPNNSVVQQTKAMPVSLTGFEVLALEFRQSLRQLPA
jgi:hypothetical protein